MKLNELVKLTSKKSQRVGRGEASGKGKTSGRGMKGQKARGKLPVSFEGGQLPIIKRLPFRRGIGNRKPPAKLTINLSRLEVFASGATVDSEALLKEKLIKAVDLGKKIKIVAGKIDKPLKILIPTTLSAKKTIEKAKGSVSDV